MLAGLLGSGGVALAATKPWIRATASVANLPTIHASASGADLVPVAGALGVAMLAAFGAVVATRGLVRRLLGIAVLIAALVVIAASLRPDGATVVLTDGLAARGWSGGDYTSDTTLWRWLAVASAVVAGLAGSLTAAYGDRWAEMGSRYDAPVREKPAVERRPEDLTETDVWRAIDQGRDPTHDV